MTQVKTAISYLGAVLLLLLATSIPAAAATLTSPSVTLSDPRTGETGVSYTFDASGFTTGTSIECIDVFLDTDADAGGSPVTGITTTGFTIDSSTAITAGSWTEDTGTNGRLRITNTSGETPSGSGNLVFAGITNGSAVNTTYYAVMTTYSDDSCTTEVDNATAAFVYKDGELVQLTIDPTLTFTCSGVALGETVNGATTTVGSTAGSIDFLNDVTFTTSGISAHDLEVATNATNGYTVYVRHTGQLSNGSDNIANHTGTNAAPTAFPSAGTEAWGYTTEDGSLAGGGAADRFTTAGDVWAGFNTSNEPIVDNPTALSGAETTRVGQQVGVSSSTPAGTYQTTIVYTVASVY